MADDWQQPGTILRHAREAKSLTIADVSHFTKISPRTIEALERDDYGSFSSPTYAKGFLHQYAEFVDVDASAWLDYFEPMSYACSDDGLLSIAPVETHPLPRSQSPSPEAAPRSSQGAGAAFLLILLTGGIIYGGLKAWPLVEQRFAEHDAVTASPTQPEPHDPPMPTPVIEIQAALLPSDSAPAGSARQISPPALTDATPPRAILVPE